MFMALLSGLVPLGIVGALPFHKMILSSFHLSDWYGDITSLEFYLLLPIAISCLVCHVVIYFLARNIYYYDRSVSVQQQKDAVRLAVQLAVNPVMQDPSNPNNPGELNAGPPAQLPGGEEMGGGVHVVPSPTAAAAAAAAAAMPSPLSMSDVNPLSSPSSSSSPWENFTRVPTVPKGGMSPRGWGDVTQGWE